MTETDTLALCLAKPLASKPTSFGANQAKMATDVATKLLQAGKVDVETFGRVISRLGNHSALRQWCIAHGFLGSANDALSIAVADLLAKSDAELLKMVE